MSIETVLRTSGVYTTILGALNQFQALTNINYDTGMETTTLNYKYRNKGALNIAPPTVPILSYFGIGVRGFVNSGTYDAIPRSGDSRMMDLYMPIPIRCVPIDAEDDKLGADRNKYRLRVVEERNGIAYAMYYLKCIEFANKIDIKQRDVDGNENDFIFDSETWLNNPPPPSTNEHGGSINTNTNRVIVRASGVCEITHDEIMEAVSVLYNGDTNYARISEIGYYTGCDVDVTNDWEYTEEGSEVAKYKEAVFVQLAKGHCFRGSELSTPNSYIKPIVTLESESCIYDIS